MEFGLEVLSFLFAVSFVAGTIDAIAGGGGLLTIPALLYVGIPPDIALATNKLQGTFGSFTSSLYFLRKQIVNLNDIKLMIFSSLIGSAIGTWLVLQIDTTNLKKLIPILLIGIGIYFLFSPKAGEVDRDKKISVVLFSLVVVSTIGFYDGFFGPGTGSFFAIAFVSLLGYNLTRATAHAKILNFTSNISALVFFMIYGKIFWLAGSVMVLGQILGSLVGSKMVLKNGHKLVRPLIVIVSFIISIKLLLS